jgi:hypothetical protein
MRKFFACMLVLAFQVYHSSLFAVVDELVVDKVMSDRGAEQRRDQGDREQKKEFEEWKRDIIGSKSVYDEELSEDVLKELHENYKRSFVGQ